MALLQVEPDAEKVTYGGVVRIYIHVRNTTKERLSGASVYVDSGEPFSPVGTCFTNSRVTCVESPNRDGVFTLDAGGMAFLQAELGANATAPFSFARPIDWLCDHLLITSGTYRPTFSLRTDLGRTIIARARTATPIELAPSERTKLIAGLAGPAMIGILGGVWAWTQKKRAEEGRRAKTERQESMVILNRLILRFHSQARDHYMPIASAVVTLVARVGDQPPDDERILHALLLFHRRAVDMANTTGVFMQAAEAEDLFNDYWDEIRKRQKQFFPEAHREPALDLVKRNLSYPQFAAERAKPASKADFDALARGVNAWRGSPGLANDLSLLNLWVWLIIIECLRPFELWYCGRLSPRAQRKLRWLIKRAKDAQRFKSLEEAVATFKQQFEACSANLPEDVVKRTRDYVSETLHRA